MNKTYLLEDVQSTTLSLSVVMAGIAPRLLPLCVLILLLFTIINDLYARRRVINQVLVNPVVRLGALFCTYAFLSALWSPDWALSAAAALTVLAMIFSAAYIVESVTQSSKNMPRRRQLRFLRAIPIGATIALSFLLIEIATGLMLTQWVAQIFPNIVGDQSASYRVSSGQETHLRSFYLNRNIAAIVLLIPSVIVTTVLWLGSRWRNIVFALAIGSASVVTFLSESETAKVALITALLVTAVSLKFKSHIRSALAIVFIVATVFAVPIARIPLHLNVHEADFLPFSARDRVVIWKHNSDLAMKHPIVGFGARATRTLHNEKADKNASSAELIARAGWHPHNMYLQIWLELGLIGALLFSVFGLSLLRAVRGLTGDVQLAGLATAATMMTYAAFGWGFWQTWSLAALAIAIAGLCVANFRDSKTTLIVADKK